MTLARQAHPSSRAEIAVWMANNIPVRIVYQGIRYRVTDTPTRLEDEMAALTHPLPWTGWRFQATDEKKVSHMFDIRRAGDDWVLLRVYD